MSEQRLKFTKKAAEYDIENGYKLLLLCAKTSVD
jgi:hypothetical protein